MIVEVRLKRIAKTEDDYRKWSKQAEHDAHSVGGDKYVSFGYGEDSFYTEEEVREILEDPDVSDIASWGPTESDSNGV